LITEAHLRPSAAAPAIDVHNHLGRWLSPTGDWLAPDVGRLLTTMDSTNLRALVNLDGRWGDELEANLDRYDRAHPGRFATFCHVDWAACERDDFDGLANSLRASVEAGACGLKVWKDLGRSVRDARGDLVLPDDLRLSELWAVAAELGIPVLIHTGDPVSHFLPIDGYNERLEELRRFPGASWLRPGMPSHIELIRSVERLAGAHPQTHFIAAHVAGWSENLGWVSRLLSDHPNVSIDISARVGDLGRQPRAAARLIREHPGQVLFGTDVYPLRAGEVAIYFRFLETEDESFAYSVQTPPPRGRWTISGLGLPADLLAAVYAGNAQRLVRSLSV
jgi:predicted TIM-barrel fold metal-dependent hydrolase